MTIRPIRKVLVPVLVTLASCAAPIWADEPLTARNKELVREFYTTVLIGRDVEAAPRFLWPLCA